MGPEHDETHDRQTPGHVHGQLPSKDAPTRTTSAGPVSASPSGTAHPTEEKDGRNYPCYINKCYAIHVTKSTTNNLGNSGSMGSINRMTLCITRIKIQKKTTTKGQKTVQYELGYMHDHLFLKVSKEIRATIKVTQYSCHGGI